MVAPTPNSTPVCAACLKRLNRVVHKCDKCSLPICSIACQDNPLHEPECQVLTENRVPVKVKEGLPNDIYSCIGPLRMMSLLEKDSPIWQLPHHNEERFLKARSEFDMFSTDVVEFLRSRCFMKNRVTEDELHRYMGIFVVNGVQLGGKGMYHGRALFPVFSAINHDCQANASFKVDPCSRTVVVKAREAVKKGQEVTVQYLVSILGTHKRRKRIRAEWYFECRCRRCQDPTELDTFVSALTCEACEQDYLLPTEPLDDLSEWSCGSCDFSLSACDAERKVDNIEEELSSVTSKRDLEALQEFVNHYSDTVLHPNHYLLLLAKRNYLFISRKQLIELLTKCDQEQQAALRQAFQTKTELYKEFWWIPERLNCQDTF